MSTDKSAIAAKHAGKLNATHRCLAAWHFILMTSGAVGAAGHGWQDGVQDSRGECAVGPKRLLVASPQVRWPQLMRFQVAVRTDATPSAVHMPNLPGHSRAARHFWAGDQAGALYMFATDGSLAGWHQTEVDSAVTAISEAHLTCAASKVKRLSA